jgi:predicted kinase
VSDATTTSAEGRGALHLVIGSTGAGKSTYSRALAGQLGAARFAIDEWMAALFLPDRPEAAGPDWYLARIARATELIFQHAAELVRLKTPVVLEIGMTQLDARAAFYRQVDQAALPLKLHVIDAPREVRWARVEARNRERGATFSMEVTRPMFDFVETMWEPPDGAELARRDGVVVDTAS